MALSHPNSLFRRSRGLDRLLGLGLLLAIALLFSGWLLPLMTVERLFLFAGEVSLLGGMLELLRQEHYFLLAILFGFSVLFPTAKLITAGYLWLWTDVEHPRTGLVLRRVEQLGRWSMLDVFVVALTVVAIEVSLVAEVAMQPGIYAFALAVLLSMAIVSRMLSLIQRFSLSQ